MAETVMSVYPKVRAADSDCDCRQCRHWRSPILDILGSSSNGPRGVLEHKLGTRAHTTQFNLFLGLLHFIRNKQGLIRHKPLPIAITLSYGILWPTKYDFFYRLDLPQKYLANNTFGTSLAFQMRVLERLEQVIFCNIWRFDLHWKLDTLYTRIGCFFLISGWWKPNFIVVHELI